jgi:predicted ribosomally synthesized peptide with SipW-like signal peptide
VLIAVGVLAVVGGGAGTFASFNAQTSNANSFATGTLLLSDTVHTGTACFSDTTSTTTNANTSTCDVLVNTSNVSPGHGTGEDITIKNTGTITSSDLKLFGSTCGDTTTGTFSSNSQLSHSDLCGALTISVEQDTTAGGTASACLIGTEIGSGSHACDYINHGVSLSTFLSTYHSAATGYAFGGDTLTANATRYYTVYLYLPDENNTYQGVTAAFNLSWQIDQ